MDVAASHLPNFYAQPQSMHFYGSSNRGSFFVGPRKSVGTLPQLKAGLVMVGALGKERFRVFEIGSSFWVLICGGNFEIVFDRFFPRVVGF